MDGQIVERVLHRQAGTTVMRWMALVARMKLLSNMAHRELNPGPEIRSPGY